MEETKILDIFLTALPYIAGIVAWFFKDKILHFLNVELKKTEIKRADKGIDTIYISNSEKLVDIYSRSMDDLTRRNDETIKSIKLQYEKDLKSMQDHYEEERVKDKKLDAKREDRLNKSIDSEKKLSGTVQDLKKEVTKLTRLVEKLTKQLKYYEEHSDIELPSDLKD